MAIGIDNRTARRIFLERQGLSRPPGRALSRQGLLALITDLGFVQVDSIGTVERAHHQILFSRHQTYRREDLTALLEQDRLLFEHWTHDASILPSAFFPYWKHRFRREESLILERWRTWREPGFEAAFEETYRRITEGGPALSRHMKEGDHKSGGWWNWHPSKTALEFLWRTGKLSISGRENFQKIYDLTERCFLDEHLQAEVTHDAFIDWACREALIRLGFATSGEIAAFWNLVSPQEAKLWLETHRAELEEIEIAPADGGKPRPSLALADRLPTLLAAPEPPARIRVLSPFDPLIRDRARTERLFGFFYRIEVFVPEPKRQYGYYVFPLLENDRLIGRIDMKANRKAGTLDVKRLWLEPGIRPSTGRLEKLDQELNRLARFTGVEAVVYGDGWLSS
ncbi:winged helix-turn-helix domain-containing protein [Agrobacterium vitis]|uniref:Winged helix-turn-helix domain-containing protein n=1 Tax=Agrobacterium vitis TaxID=373 RepID=A0A368NXK9_AGRVI|nr:winged helix-turn-helix domain-containing protein [Agrobacterium vitis]KAA3519834.1 winged helix-turn-helix domain-containing protein [Agrobacterium vitis]KAA3531952.1 winged helix-turn-helix domain-containing protein [Agrobacterium vitis]MCF1467416.1 winged helix-turn-helix domain-containing protein [Agrobacterium vitis]MCF1476017.1 winged helix-turn-helix domain-containing protein [Agrobacterium vitis]MUZ96924.1 winged helix-turn-helix domain-containing protein [Agrobacterium vitis]